WLHNHCSFPARREDFLPVADRRFRDTTVRVPRDTEKFLRGHYGPGWTVPDPGFSYHLSEIDPAVLENLSRALIGVREYRELAERVRREVGDSPRSARLVSIGSQDLYPLDGSLPCGRRTVAGTRTDRRTPARRRRLSRPGGRARPHRRAAAPARRPTGPPRRGGGTLGAGGAPGGTPAT